MIPHNLPLLLRWRAGVCVQAAIVEDIALDGPLAPRVRLKPLVDAEEGDPSENGVPDLPDLWAEFGKAACEPAHECSRHPSGWHDASAPGA